MSARHVAVEVILWLGVGLSVIAAFGLLLCTGPYERLHLASLMSVGAALIGVAIFVNTSFSLVGNKALLVAAFLLLCSPVLTHATGRAVRLALRRDPGGAEEDHVEVERA